MAHRFPSEEWTAAFKDAVNDNAAYRKAGAAWTHGAVAMVIAADPALGLEEPVGMILDVHGGQCRGAEYVRGMDAVAGVPFVIVAPRARWREVIEGKLDPIKGMMEGKLKLTVGHLPTMIRYVESSRQLVVSAANVPTEFVE
ncbi:MAG: SCP2 sterol-binding domain-containing protein [Myxococcales bacterium]|nr:SCP2 sterol-binding domain-containing protein [Myxococcales bacterium]